MGAIKIWNGTAWETASQQGPAGPVVLPVGGSTGQVLAKKSPADFDTAWTTAGCQMVTLKRSPGYTVPPSGDSSIVGIATTLPVAGTVVTQAFVTVVALSGTTIQQVGLKFVQAPGGPVVATGQDAFMSGTPFPRCTIPVWGNYGAQPAGPCTVGLVGTCAAGGVTLQIVDIALTVFVQP